MKKIQLSYLPAIAWFIISTILLTLPGTAFPKENWLDKIWFDKWVHIGMFAIMVTLWSWAMLKNHSGKKGLRQVILWIGFVCLAYGIGMEFVQKYFIPNRSFDIRDIIADGIGCAGGFFFSIWRYLKK